MKREELRNSVMDAFVLQGQVESAGKKIGSLSGKIRVNEEEIERLKVIETETQELKAERDKESKELQKMEGDLKALLDKLEGEGVKLPMAVSPAPMHIKF